jgi:hypothetical protein
VCAVGGWKALLRGAIRFMETVNFACLAAATVPENSCRSGLQSQYPLRRRDQQCQAIKPAERPSEGEALHRLWRLPLEQALSSRKHPDVPMMQSVRFASAPLVARGTAAAKKTISVNGLALGKPAAPLNRTAAPASAR